MGNKNRLLANVLCLLMVVFCVVGLTACRGNKECSHEWGEWSVAQGATCTEAGVQKRTCAKCEETESSSITALGHDFAEATCSTPKTCKNCSATEGAAKAHAYTVSTAKAEALKSAANCQSAAVYYKSCACGAISTSDADTFTVGTPLAHTDEDKNHTCDNCPTALGDHADANKDHNCDYGCNTAIGTCEDADFDHACDYGCTKLFGICADANLDHECDHGCDKVFGTHSDANTDADHVCDYGCGAIIEDCSDAEDDGDHNCDICGLSDVTDCDFGAATCGAPATCSECGATTGETLAHIDANRDHVCDNGCGKNDIGLHADSLTDDDHVCDYGCLAILTTCYDTEGDKDHACDVCAKADVTSHSYTEDASLATPATCEAAATKTFVCNCGDSYTEDEGDALNHSITGAKAVERLVSGCEYVLVYTCQRGDCGAEVLGETVYKHTHIASISKPATCSADGEKTFKCSVCGDTSKAAEPIPADATGHNWIIGETIGGARTDTCSICSTTKTVIVSDSNSASSNASDLANTDVQLKVDDNTNANIQLGQGVADAIGDKDITISAGVVDETTLKDMGVSDDQLGQIGGNTVYDFNIIDENGTNVSNFGDNYVTITLPYELGKGEDVDSIAVWFIGSTCQVESCDKGEGCVDAHKLVSIEATYNNGFVTFQTNHFSIYTVTRLTPAERCALYGHGYTCQHVEGNCTKDSYDLYVCVRCHDKYIDEETLVVADGHDYVAETHNATCTESGYVLYTCDDCGHAYRTKINATGHDFALEDFAEASCMADGYEKYGCQNCDEEYTITYAKNAHVYTNTVVSATCAADGYTIHDCNNCDYSYTDAYVTALGHEYGNGTWSWEANGNKATLTLVCAHDEAHATTLHVISTMDKVVSKGECSNYVIRTHTASVEFNGVTYTDTLIIRQGNPQHIFATEWTVGEDAHWHECICGEKTDVTAHSFGNATTTKNPGCNEAGEATSYCSVCGKATVTSIPATGEHNYVDGVCTVCGTEFVDTYYVNLINSWKNINGFAIKIQNFSFELKQKESNLVEAFKLIGSIKQLDIAELSLFVEDGEIGGAATGSISIFNGPISNANAIYNFKAVIHEGFVYISLEHGKDVANKNIYIKATLDSLLDSMIEDGLGISTGVTAVAELFVDVLIPAIDTLIDLNSENVDAILESAFNMLFTFEKQDDGSYIATLDYEKLYALNENLATKSIAELIDIYFGEGKFDDLADFVLEILNLEISEIPAYLDEQGLNSAELIEKINEFAAKAGAPADFDIADMIYGEDYEGITLGMLIFGKNDDSYVDIFNDIEAQLREYSLYELIEPNHVDDIKDAVDAILDLFAESALICVSTDRSGMLTSINIAADAFVYTEEDNEAYINFNLDIIINGTIDVTWYNIIEEIESKIVLPEDEMLEDDLHSYTNGHYSGYVMYQGEEYYYSNGMQITAYKPHYGNLAYIMICTDCSGWMAYEACYGETRYLFTIATITVDDEPVVLLIDDYSGEVVALVETENGFIAIFEDGTEKEIEFDLNAYMPGNPPSGDIIINGGTIGGGIINGGFVSGGTIGGGISSPSIGGSYVPSYDYVIVDLSKAYADLYFAVFENPEGMLNPLGEYVNYYYNTTLGEYATETHHDLEFEYIVNGDFCREDGCTEIITCKNCDYYESYTRYGCDEEYREISLEDLGLCGGWIEERYCSICNTILSTHLNSDSCDWVRAEDNADGYAVYECRACGAIRLSNTILSEKDENCRYTWTEVRIYIVDGEEVFRQEYSYRDISHNYKYEYIMNGTSCLDGYTVITTCEDCNYSWSGTYNSHNTNRVFTLGAEHGCCDEHYIEISVCPCGYSHYINFDSYNFDYNFEMQAHVCEDCNLTIVQVTDPIEEGCTLIETRTFSIVIADEVVYSYEKESTYANHSFTDVEVSIVGGTTYITTACDACGEISSTEILTVELENHNGQYYYDYTFTPNESATYSIIGLADRDTCVTLYKMVDGRLVEVSYNDDGAGNLQFFLSCNLTEGTTYVYRIRFLSSSDHGSISFALTQGDAGGTSCRHDEYKEFSVLLDGSETCADGVLCGSLYTGCGCVGNVRVEYQHETFVKEIIDLSEYGACYGEYVYNSCACGQEHDMYLRNSCYDTSTSNKYYDDNGRLIYVETRTCSSCNLRYTREYYSVKNHENCTATYYYTVVINVGTRLVAETEYTVVAADHDFEITGTLMKGAESSCKEGAVINHKCRDCGYEYNYETYYHENYEKERIDLSALGNVCGGYASLYGCACGYNNSLSLEHSLCEWGNEGCMLWIEDAITEGQYNINGWNYYDYESYLYTCAVTDPEDAACAFKIRYATYWLKDANSCTAHRYATWQFGYNEENGTYRYEITLKRGEGRVYHDYVDSSTDYNTKYDCPDCGSYYYVNNYYENGNHVKYEKLVSNTLNNGYDKYHERIEEYTRDADGYWYTSRVYYKYIHSDDSVFWEEELRTEQGYTGPFGDSGRKVSYSCTNSDGYRYSEEYAYVLYKGYEFRIYTYRTESDSWYRYDYTYTFNNGCVQTAVYTNSDGTRNVDVYDICKFYNHLTIKNPTCSQDGSECRECVICGKRTDFYTIYPHDHNWVNITGDWHYCSTCGMENANGVSGDIIMEDMTEEYGNGEYYVVGYYARNNVKFSQYVSLIFEDGMEIVVTGVDFITIDGIRAYAFSKAAVEAWANENGYTDYNVKFSFVPDGSDGSFDYGVTFTETIDFSAIVGNVSFKDYIGAGVTKSYTIKPTEDGVWTFTSFADRDTYGYLYDADGNCLTSDDDDGYNNNFMMTYELKAGETYTVQVRWYYSDNAGTMALLFGVL